MTLFLLRDDDTNATTDPDRLERAYAPLLDAGLPITFSVIPRVALDTQAPDGLPERYLPPSLAGVRREVPLTAFSPWAQWLRAHGEQCSVAQHGLDHRRVRGGTELGSLTYREAEARVRLGRDILHDALGTDPTAFVAPWDALSPEALEVVVERFPVVSTSWLGPRRLPLRWWPAHVAERLSRSEVVPLGQSIVLRHRGGLVGPHTDPADVAGILDRLSIGAEVTVVVLHHWMFWDRPDPHPVVTALARALRGRPVVQVERLARAAAHHGPWSLADWDPAERTL
jgi:peptidoglycan/xylan/chitin deacetylase (PgdA/CDA1 family)